jgi:hypothetical protein
LLEGVERGVEAFAISLIQKREQTTEDEEENTKDISMHNLTQFLLKIKHTKNVFPKKIKAKKRKAQ